MKIETTFIFVIISVIWVIMFNLVREKPNLNPSHMRIEAYDIKDGKVRDLVCRLEKSDLIKDHVREYKIYVKDGDKTYELIK